MDISMPGMNGIDATRQITRAHPGTKVIALSMHSGHSHVAEMLRAGASAYVLKEAAFDELRLAVRAVLSGDSYLSPAVAAQVARVFRNAPPSQQTSPLSSLSERERTVLQHLAEGRSRKEIAAELAISVKSVETHCSAVMRKLGLCNVADLTKYAIREGLTTL
jgi:DNA-binding NarL/FixJ family response regulator